MEDGAASFELIPEHIQRMLGDRSYDRRKSAALTVESTIKSLEDQGKSEQVRGIIQLLGDQFTRSPNANHRKGGLIGLAAAAIGLMKNIYKYLPLLLPPVVHCFQDPESRVRYYACEALFNIAKVARQRILGSFNEIFAGLCELYSDVDVDVKNGAQLLDRLVKEIVTESDAFDVEQFIPLLQRRLKTRNPYIRQLLVGWITVLDSVPFINMLDYLPNFLEGLFNMLSDDIREIRQQADQALCEFLQEIKEHDVSTLELGPIVDILVGQCGVEQARFNRLTSIQWIRDIIHLGGERLMPLYATLLVAVLRLLADEEREIRDNARDTDEDLLLLVKETQHPDLRFAPLLTHLERELKSRDETTRLASLAWISMLLEKDAKQALERVDALFPAFFRALSDPCDEVVLLDLEVLARVASDSPEQFERSLEGIVALFRDDRQLLEQRGSLIVRNLCLHLRGEKVYATLARILLKERDMPFARVMIQALSLILLTADELLELRTLLQGSCAGAGTGAPSKAGALGRMIGRSDGANENADPNDPKRGFEAFQTLYRAFAHNAVATFSLCLLAQAYPLSAALVSGRGGAGESFAGVEVTLGFLMQIDKLVQLLESPIFVRLRLQLLDPDAEQHRDLMKSLYGLLMLLPQSSAFKTLRDRLTSVSALYLAIPPSARAPARAKEPPHVAELLAWFAEVQGRHRAHRVRRLRQQSSLHGSEQTGEGGGGAGSGEEANP
jgi:vacuole morphology and inheritance protein 14